MFLYTIYTNNFITSIMIIYTSKTVVMITCKLQLPKPPSILSSEEVKATSSLVGVIGCGEQSFIEVVTHRNSTIKDKCTALGMVLGYHNFQFIDTMKSILYQV